jgi:hypothetical protein
MPDLVKRPRYQIGDEVRFKHGARLVGRVMRARGTYSPTGHVLYEIYVPMSSEPLILPAREEDIEKV